MRIEQVSKRAGDGTVVHVAWPRAGVDEAREETFERLRVLVEHRDPMPEDVVAGARLSFELRSVDEELAQLVYDSMIDDDLLAGVRSGGASGRQLTFASRGLVLELEVGETADRNLLGQVVPPQAAEVQMRHRMGTVSATADHLGCFRFETIPGGPISLSCSPTAPDRSAVSTSWVTL